MKRLVVLSPVLFALAACGGNEAATSAPTGNGTAAEADLPIDEPVYDGDNLTIIDAAANDAATQPLAPDMPTEGMGNMAMGNESGAAD
jgi:hypothetical protein